MTRRERESRSKLKKKKQRKWTNVSVFPSVHVCLTSHPRMCARTIVQKHECVYQHKPCEDGADVHSAAALAKPFSVPQKEGIFLLCFKFHSPSNWAQTCLENK